MKKVDFIIVGAHAVAFHGHPRLTGDLDILISTSKENSLRIQEVCETFGFSGPPFRAEEFRKPMQTFQLGRVPNRLDILTGITGISNQDAFSNKQQGMLDGLSVYYISKADLILNKQLTGRPKDLADIAILESRSS